MSNQDLQFTQLIAVAQHNVLVRRQIYQLQQTNAQLAYQARQQQVNGQLADILFHTELRARQLTNVSEKDPFAAGLMSAMWLASCAGVSTDHYRNVEEKRAWQTASTRLQVLRDTVWSDERLRNNAEGFFRAIGEESELMRKFDSGLLFAMDVVIQRAVAIKDTKARMRRLALYSLTLPPILFLGLCVAVFVVDNNTGAGLVLVSMLSIPLIVVLFCMWGWKSYELHDATKEIQETQPLYEAWQAFLKDPRGGQLLRLMRETHPALISPLPAVEPVVPQAVITAAPPPSVVAKRPPVVVERPSVVVERQLVVERVERQTVVARCKYCQSLTPVDAAVCQNCGALKFI